MCSSDLYNLIEIAITLLTRLRFHPSFKTRVKAVEVLTPNINGELFIELLSEIYLTSDDPKILKDITLDERVFRSEEHTSELQSHSFISYAVFCLKKKKNKNKKQKTKTTKKRPADDSRVANNI